MFVSAHDGNAAMQSMDIAIAASLPHVDLMIFESCILFSPCFGICFTAHIHHAAGHLCPTSYDCHKDSRSKHKARR
jgi:hypothetical protein